MLVWETAGEGKYMGMAESNIDELGGDLAMFGRF